jgi:DNA polymerase
MTMQGSRNAAFLQEIGVGPLWLRRDAAAAASAGASDIEPPLVEKTSQLTMDADAGEAVAAQAVAVSEMNWTQLKQAVSTCRQCGLCENRRKTVFGVGDEQAKWLFVGEGPGRNEDAQGEPFVGPAGKLLDNMLAAIGLKRGANAYIANIAKCRPTDANGKDRPPSVDEIAACIPYLNRQIALIQPQVIVALGKTAALALLKRDPATPVSALRGTVHRYGELPLIVTYHPAYLLRSLADKRKTWDDLCLAMQTYARAGA